jgi:integrase
MARSIHRLTDLRVRRERTPGLYHDGGGLYLQVTVSESAPGEKSWAKSWVFRYMLRGKAREMGLGSLTLVSLADARARAIEARRLCLEGVDPIDHRKAKRAAQALDDAKAMTFDQCSDGFVADHEAGWTPRHKRVWENSIRNHVSPVFGSLSVSAIDEALVLKVLKPMWSTKHVTAKNLRERIEAVLDWARVHKYRQGDNPARWKGHLQNILAKPDDVHVVEHHPALPYAQINELIAEMKARDDRDARCLLLLILTATRVDATVGARAEEFDLANRVWTIPASRMKRRGKRKKLGFRVPLSNAAVAIVKAVGVSEGLLFPDASDKSLARAHARDDMVTHGLRSSFRDWAAERTAFPREVIEMAMGHVVAAETEEAYFRSDLLEKRRKLMDAWAAYCGKPVGDAEVLRPHFGGHS